MTAEEGQAGGEVPAPVLVAEGVSFSYPGRAVLHEVSVSLMPGTLTTVLGPNGSGKSTLIKVLLGQLRPSGGAVGWFGRQMGRWGRREFARRVAYLPQSPSAAATDTVMSVLRLGRTPHLPPLGLESAADLAIVRETAELLALTDLLNEPLSHLSGGQRQRAFLARCLVQQPEALLLDEPTTYLDLRHQIDLMHLLRSLATARGIAVLMSGHDLNLAGAFSERVLVLEGGRTAGYGPAAEVLTSGLVSRVYGTPMTQVGRYLLPLLPHHLR